MRRLGLDALLEFIAAYDSGFGAKPAPDPVLAFAKFANLPPAEIAVVGDTVHDLVAARAPGALAIGVLSGPTDGALLEPLADVILPSVAELEAWIDQAV
jgi:phosphoglycolate phosphatase